MLARGLDYVRSGAFVPVKPAALVLRLQHPHLRSPAVRRVQQALKSAGFHPGPIGGVFGEQTALAAYAFQTTRGLVQDGEVGAETAKALGIKLA